jgi:GntR family transcriptional regulator
LIAENQLVRIHGKGTFVQQKLILEQQPMGRIAGFSRDLVSRGIPFETKVFHQEIMKPSTEIARLLSLDQDESIFHIKRLRIIQEKPIVYVENHVAHNCCEGIEEIDFEKEALYSVLENEFEFKLDWARRTYHAKIADQVIAKRLELEIGAPIMYLEELYHLIGDQPVEFTKAWINAEVFHITTRIRREDEKKEPPEIYR